MRQRWKQLLSAKGGNQRQASVLARSVIRELIFPFRVGSSLHSVRMEALAAEEIGRVVLAEHVGDGDITTLATIAPNTTAKAVMIAREPMVVAGLPIAEAVFGELSAAVLISRTAKDRDHVATGQSLLRVAGPAQAILTGKRVALNFVQRLSGIATLIGQTWTRSKAHARKFSTRARPRPACDDWIRKGGPVPSQIYESLLSGSMAGGSRTATLISYLTPQRAGP